MDATSLSKSSNSSDAQPEFRSRQMRIRLKRSGLTPKENGKRLNHYRKVAARSLAVCANFAKNIMKGKVRSKRSTISVTNRRTKVVIKRCRPVRPRRKAGDHNLPFYFLREFCKEYYEEVRQVNRRHNMWKPTGDKRLLA